MGNLCCLRSWYKTRKYIIKLKSINQLIHWIQVWEITVTSFWDLGFKIIIDCILCQFLMNKGKGKFSGGLVRFRYSCPFQASCACHSLRLRICVTFRLSVKSLCTRRLNSSYLPDLGHWILPTCPSTGSGMYQICLWSNYACQKTIQDFFWGGFQPDY